MPDSNRINRACFIRNICLGAGALGATGSAMADENFRLVDEPRIKRDWGDKRSRKVMFLAHCMTNMNARMHNCTQVFAASAEPLVRYCLDHKLGMAVMPCPELLVTGLGRDRDQPEKEYLKEVLEEPVAREKIRELAKQVVFQMKEYRYQGFEMVALIGNDGSPSCGVDRTSFADPDGRFGPGQGVFIQELRKLMDKAGLDIPMKGIDDEKVDEVVAWLEKTVSS